MDIPGEVLYEAARQANALVSTSDLGEMAQVIAKWAVREERRKRAAEPFYTLLADAWDEGLSAGCDRWMDSREFGDAPVNPYRKGE